MSHRIWIVPVLFLLCVASQVSARTTGSLHFEIETKSYPQVVFLSLPTSSNEWKHIAFREATATNSLSTQRISDTELAVILPADDTAGQKKFVLASNVASKATKASGSMPRVEDNGSQLVVTVDDKPVLRYNHQIVESPEGLSPDYRRSGHIHPIYNPKGQMVTDDFSPQHAHQHGVMFAWRNTTYDGRKVNFWEQPAKQGTVLHAKTLALENGPVFAQFKVQIDHNDITTEKSIHVLQEIWTVRVYGIEDYFVIDLESRQQCMTAQPLQIHEFHYGGFAIRASRQWENSKGDFLTSEGKTKLDGNHSRPIWTDIHGKIDGHATGVAILCHPQNFRFPQPVRLHPSMPYFCFAPMVLGEFELSKDDEYVSRYRFVVHDGEAQPKMLNEIWGRFGSKIVAMPRK